MSNLINREPIHALLLSPVLRAEVAAVTASSDLTSDNTNVTAGKVVTIGDITYEFVAALSVDALADAELTSDNTNVSNGDTVTIGAITYTFRTSLTTIPRHLPYEVKIGANADASLANLKAAINGASGAGVTYSSGTIAHPYVTAGTIAAHVLPLTAKGYGATYESLATTEVAAHLSFGDVTMENGTHTVAYEVLIGADADATLANLKAAINGAAGAGTTYGVGTVAHADVTAGVIAAHVLPITAKEAGAAGNSIATTTDEAHLSWDDATLLSGVDYVAESTGIATIGGEGGLVQKIIVIAPSMDGAATTLTVAVKDEDNNQIYVTGSCNENATTVTDLADKPLFVRPTDYILVTPSAAQDDTTIDVILR